jgi:hypothetical protein
MTTVELALRIAHDIAARSPDYSRPNESEDLQPMRGNEKVRRSEAGGRGVWVPCASLSTGP